MVEIIEEMQRVREAAEEVRDQAADFLMAAKVEYDLKQFSHDEISTIIADKWDLFAKVSDHMIAVKVAMYLLDRQRRKDHPSYMEVSFRAEADLLRKTWDELSSLRFCCLDLKLSLDRVASGLAELKRTMFERRPPV
jgi:hypothetical protein